MKKKEEEEKAYLCLIVDTTSEGSNSESDEEVNINNLETLQLEYQELLSNSSTLSIAYQNLRKDFNSVSKDYKQLQGKHEEKIDNSLEISTQVSDNFESLKLETTKLHLENDEICK